MNLRIVSEMIYKQYGYRVRPTDVAATLRDDGDIYFRLPDGRNGIVVTIEQSDAWMLPMIERRIAA